MPEVGWNYALNTAVLGMSVKTLSFVHSWRSTCQPKRRVQPSSGLCFQSTCMARERIRSFLTASQLSAKMGSWTALAASVQRTRCPPPCLCWWRWSAAPGWQGPQVPACLARASASAREALQLHPPEQQKSHGWRASACLCHTRRIKRSGIVRVHAARQLCSERPSPSGAQAPWKL